jgi:hypothetical protein
LDPNALIRDKTKRHKWGRHRPPKLFRNKRFGTVWNETVPA